jgi:hypothetical protein
MPPLGGPGLPGCRNEPPLAVQKRLGRHHFYTEPSPGATLSKRLRFIILSLITAFVLLVSSDFTKVFFISVILRSLTFAGQNRKSKNNEGCLQFSQTALDF